MIDIVFQFGNTCYSNSVLQALYFCRPFREKVLEYKAKNKRTKETLLTCLADLFYSIATQKKKVGSIAPKKFIARLRKEKGTLQYYISVLMHKWIIISYHKNFFIMYVLILLQKSLIITCNKMPMSFWISWLIILMRLF